MKYLIPILLLVISAKAEPSDILFLRTLLPRSEHQYTHVIQAKPLGYILVHYTGEDTFATAIERLNKSLETRLVEIPTPEKKDPFLKATLQFYQSASQDYRVATNGDLTVDFVFFQTQNEGVTKRHIYMKIQRKSA